MLEWTLYKEGSGRILNLGGADALAPVRHSEVGQNLGGGVQTFDISLSLSSVSIQHFWDYLRLSTSKGTQNHAKFAQKYQTKSGSS